MKKWESQPSAELRAEARLLILGEFTLGLGIPVGNDRVHANCVMDLVPPSAPKLCLLYGFSGLVVFGHISHLHVSHRRLNYLAGS